MAALEPVIATLVADIAQFQASMAEAKASMEELGASADTADAEGSLGALGAAGSQAGRDVKLGAEEAVGGLGGMGVAAEDAKGKVKDAEGATKDLGNAADETGGKLSGKVSEGLSKFGNLLSNTGVPGVTSLGKSLERTGEEADKMGSSAGSLFTSFAGAGKIATLGLGVAFAGAAVEGLHLATNMQSAEAQISTSAGITTAAAHSIGQAFLQTAGTTEFSGIEMAQAFGQVAGQLKSAQGAALTTAQATQVMGAASDLATAKQVSLGTATTALAATMQAFQIKASDASNVSDILFNASNATGQSITSLGAALDKVKTKLGGMAPPIGQLSGLLVDMTNHGETGRAAMQSLTTTFTAFLKPASEAATAQNSLKVALEQLPPSLQALGAQVANGTLTSTQYAAATAGLSTSQATLIGNVKTAQTAMTNAQAATAKLGISTLTASGQLQPMSAIIGQLHDKIQGMNTAQATAELTALGFGNASAKLVSTIQAGAGAYNAATAAATKMGAAHAAAAKQAATLHVEMATLKATAEDLLTQFGQALLPVLQTVAGGFEKATEFIIKSKAALIALGVLVGGPLAVIIGAFIIQSISKLISFVTEAGSTVAQFGSKLLGLGTPAQTVGTDVGNASKEVNSAVDSMATGADTASTTFAGAMSTMGEAADALQGTVAAAMTAIEGDVAAASSTISETVTETTTGAGATGALGTAGAGGAAGAAGASGAAGAATSAEAATSIFEPAVVALQGAATSLEAAASSLSEAAGATTTAAGDTTAAAGDVTASAADTTASAADTATDSATINTAAAALDSSAAALDTAAGKLSLGGVGGAAGTAEEGAAAEGGAAAGETSTVEDAAGEGIAASFLKGVAGKAIGGLIAVQLYNAFLEKPLGKKIGTDAASILGDAGTGAAIGLAIGGPLGAVAGAGIAAAWAARGQVGGGPGAGGIGGKNTTSPGGRGLGTASGPGSNLGTGGNTSGYGGTLGGGNPAPTPQLSPAQQDRAKDSTLQKEISVMSLLNANVVAAKSQDGVNSAQYRAAINAVNTTAEKYFPTLGKDTSLAGVKLQEFAVAEQIGQLKIANHADQVNGNQQLEAAQKAVTKLEGEAATEKTGQASKAAIDLTNQQLNEAKSHLADIKSVVSDGTNTQHQIKSDTTHLSTLENLAGTMSKVNTDTSALRGDITGGIHSDLTTISSGMSIGLHGDLTTLASSLHSDLTSGGITVNKLPSQTMKLSGAATLNVSS